MAEVLREYADSASEAWELSNHQKSQIKISVLIKTQ